MERLSVKQLCSDEVDAILNLEAVCFSPCLRATKETLEERFRLGHIMLGLYEEEQLIGLASFAYNLFDSKAETRQFCEQEWTPFYKMKMAEKYNTLIVYNVEIFPSKRGTKYVDFLLNAMMQRGFEDGCRHLIGIARIPSYNGDSANRVHQKIALKEAIDGYFETGVFPTMELFRKDPLLALYEKIGRCTILCLKKGYVSEDTASGGIRAIVYTALTDQWK